MSAFDKKIEELIPHLLFIDIETVSGEKDWHDLDEVTQLLWSKKAIQLQKNVTEKEEDSKIYENRAAIYSEFGKIVCISLGFIAIDENKEYNLHIKSLINDDEKQLIEDFFGLIKKFEKRSKKIIFVGHNIKEFDLPYICRRCIIAGLELPAVLHLNTMKPWEIPHLDTLELWRFGDYKHFISLQLMAHILQIESPKDEMDGSKVSSIYWKEGRLDDIASYCNKDVATVAKIFFKLKNMDKKISVIIKGNE